MAANPATEPRNGTKSSSDLAANRLVSLVLGQGLGVSEALRQLAAGTDGGPPETIGRTAADRILRDERRRVADRATVSEAAARVLSLVSRELAALEAQTGPKDLDRLHKVGQILATVDRLRPKQTDEKEAGLLQLAEEDETEAQPSQHGQI